jgi:uncharacterized membrane protein
MELKDFKAFYEKNGAKLWFLGIFGTIAVISLGCLLMPEIFWDKFMYRYFWGPLEVDALESGPIRQSDGYVIDQGYTLVSEITYGLVLILALYGIYRLLERLKIKIDLRFVLTVIPYFFLGATLRVLEDAELFREPYVYFFISPIIYFVIGGLILVMILLLLPLEKKEDIPINKRFFVGILPFVIFNVVYLIIYFLHSDGFNYLVHFGVPLVFSILMMWILFFDSLKKVSFDPYTALFCFGLFLLVFTVFVIMLWPSVGGWKNAYLSAHGKIEVTTEPFAGPLIIGISVGITFCVFVAARFLRNKFEVMSIFTDPINLLIVFGQMLDAVATFVGVDLYGYAEKHPIPDFLFQTFGTSAIFIPVKLALACAMVYLIDISFKEELKDYPVLRGLIKILIIVLGLAPGTRDLVRTMMGV